MTALLGLVRGRAAVVARSGQSSGALALFWQCDVRASLPSRCGAACSWGWRGTACGMRPQGRPLQQALHGFPHKDPGKQE